MFGAAAYDSSSKLFSALDDIKPADVYLRLADAVQLLEWAWGGFYPAGTAVAAEEVGEANRRLELWWRRNEAAWGVQKLRMNFAAFERWFCLCVEELVRDRANFVRDASHYHEHANVFDKHHHHRHLGEEKGDTHVTYEFEVEASPQPLPLAVESAGTRTPKAGELFDLRSHIDSLLGALEDGDQGHGGAAGGGPAAPPDGSPLYGSPEAALKSYMQRSVLAYDDDDNDSIHAPPRLRNDLCSMRRSTDCPRMVGV